MAEESSLRQTCLALPEVTGDGIDYGVKSKDKVRGTVWAFKIRPELKKGRIPSTDRIE